MSKQPKSLREFWRDSLTKDNVHNYLIQFLEEEGLKKMFKKQDTTGIAEAKEMIDKAFENMNVLFEPKAEKKEPINHSR